MRIFTFLCALALLGIGSVSYYGWEGRGWEGPIPTSAVPAGVGAVMLLGAVVSLLLRKTGLQIAFLASLMGAGLGVGRLLPSYLKEAFDPQEPFTVLLLGMAGVCSVYALVSMAKFLFRRRPVKGGKKRKDPVPATDVSEANPKDEEGTRQLPSDWESDLPSSEGGSEDEVSEKAVAGGKEF